MAEKRNATTYDGIAKAIKEKQFSPIYLLMGDEPYYIDKLTDMIVDNALKPEDRDYNMIVMYGLDTSAVQVTDTAMTVPMMADRQVIVVREAQLMKGIEQLEKYMRHPTPSTILVICYKKEAPKGKKGWIGEAEKNGIVFESKKIRDYAVPSFVTSYAKAKGKDIEQKASSMIADAIGADLSRISCEIDKLLITMNESEKRITAEMVEEQIGISKDFNTFELRDAVAKKDVMKCNRIMKYFDKNPKAGNLHSAIPIIFPFFQNLMAAYYCPKRNNEEELALWLGLRSGWAAREYISAMRLYTPMKTMQIIQKLRTTAAKSNGIYNKSATDGELMQEMLFFILH